MKNYLNRTKFSVLNPRVPKFLSRVASSLLNLPNCTLLGRYVYVNKLVRKSNKVEVVERLIDFLVAGLLKPIAPQ